MRRSHCDCAVTAMNRPIETVAALPDARREYARGPLAANEWPELLSKRYNILEPSVALPTTRGAKIM